jgi:hypothetical protein
MRLLDPRFKFDPRANEQRRMRLRSRISVVTPDERSEIPAIRALVKLTA